MVIYSYSRIDTFEKCQLKFKFKYIDKIQPELEKSIEAHLGEMVHLALEWLYQEVLDGRIPSIDDLIFFYSKKWNEEYREELQIIKQGTTKEDYFNKGVKFLLDYYIKHKPFDDNTLELEKEVKITLDKEGKYKLRGFIDRLALNPKTGEYEVHDYKTSNNIPNGDKLNNDKQLSIYSLAIKNIFGNDKKVCLVWHYLAYDQKICLRKTDEELIKTKNEIIDSIKKIESTKEFYPNKSILCNWCEYRTICECFKGGK